jgi:hypothetical protein
MRPESSTSRFISSSENAIGVTGFASAMSAPRGATMRQSAQRRQDRKRRFPRLFRRDGLRPISHCKTRWEPNKFFPRPAACRPQTRGAECPAAGSTGGQMQCVAGPTSKPQPFAVRGISHEKCRQPPHISLVASPFRRHKVAITRELPFHYARLGPRLARLHPLRPRRSADCPALASSRRGAFHWRLVCAWDCEGPPTGRCGPPLAGCASRYGASNGTRQSPRRNLRSVDRSRTAPCG